jgi:hypothetical protein
MREPPHLGKDLYKGMVQFEFKDPAEVLIDWGKKRVLRGVADEKTQAALTAYRKKATERSRRSKAAAKVRRAQNSRAA